MAKRLSAPVPPPREAPAVELDVLIARLGRAFHQGQETLQRRQDALLSTLLRLPSGVARRPVRFVLGDGAELEVPLLGLVTPSRHHLSEMVVELPCELVELPLEAPRFGLRATPSGPCRPARLTLRITLRPHHQGLLEIETRVSGVLLRREASTRETTALRSSSPSRSPKASDGEPIYLLRADEVALIRDAHRSSRTDADDTTDAEAADAPQPMSSARADE